MNERRILLVNVCIAGAVGAAVLVGERLAIRGSAQRAEASSAPARVVVEAARVAEVLRALKVVTVEIVAPVTSESIDRSWRGDVEARVTATARLYYGVDLLGIADSCASRDPLTGAWVVRTPAPARLAAEVLTGNEKPDVCVSGTRLRDVAGEYHLGLARTRLYQRAQEMVLGPEQREKVETLSREQIARLVRTLVGGVGGEVPVRVEFERSELTSGEPGGVGVEAR